MIKQKKTSDAIFQTNFHSAEGYYSQLVFKQHILVKIIGRGYDDFNKDPVIVNSHGQLTRFSIAELDSKLKYVVMNSNNNSNNSDGVSNLPPIVVRNHLLR